MNRILAAAAIATALTAASANAGSVADPILEAEVIEMAAADSSIDPQMFLVLFTALVVVAASN